MLALGVVFRGPIVHFRVRVMILCAGIKKTQDFSGGISGVPLSHVDEIKRAYMGSGIT